MTNKRKIILDCDPGQDDMVAIIVAGAYPGFDLLGISVVAGNHTLENTTRNTLNICSHLGIDVPVYAGCSGPLVREKITAGEIHGSTGLDGPVFAPHTKCIEKEHAVNWLIDSFLKSEGDITLVITGPMTNVAMAMRMEPAIIDKIDQIVLMGGAYSLGNVTPAAEFNIFADPEAAHIVFGCGRPITMVGLDVTKLALCDEEVIDRMAVYQNPASYLFEACMRFYCAREEETYHTKGAPVHDPVTMAYLIDPTVLVTKPMHVEVDLKSELSYGRTVCDYYGKNPDANVNVAIDLDKEKFWNIVEKAICSYSNC